MAEGGLLGMVPREENVPSGETEPDYRDRYQLTTLFQFFLAIAVAEKTVVADAMEAVG